MRFVGSVRVRLAGACLLAAIAAAPAAAQELTPVTSASAQALLSPRFEERQIVAPLAAAARIPSPRRPGVLVPLYGSLVTLQALDIHSTYSALAGAGAREANPVMAPVVKNRAAFTLVKASSTAGLLWATEKMWKKNRKGAVIFALAANAGMALVVSHNYRVAARAR